MKHRYGIKHCIIYNEETECTTRAYICHTQYVVKHTCIKSSCVLWMLLCKQVSHIQTGILITTCYHSPVELSTEDRSCCFSGQHWSHSEAYGCWKHSPFEFPMDFVVIWLCDDGMLSLTSVSMVDWVHRGWSSRWWTGRGWPRRSHVQSDRASVGTLNHPSVVPPYLTSCTSHREYP